MISLYKNTYCALSFLLLVVLFDNSFSLQYKDSLSKITINNLLPTPQVIEQVEGEMTLTPESIIFYSADCEELVPVISRYLDLFEERYHFRFSSQTKKGLNKFQIQVSDNKHNQIPRISPNSNLKEKGEEVYNLLVRSEGITIDANSLQGVRWALMTVLQLGPRKTRQKLSCLP